MADWISRFLAPVINALLNPRITAAISITAGILLYLNSRRFLPVTLQPAHVLGLIVAGVLCGCLFCINLASSVWTATGGARRGLMRLIERHRDKKRVEREMPFLTPKERAIIAYLLAKNQKMFEVLPDGEEAATLISKGFVAHPARHPIALHRDIVVEIPNHVWEVLVEHRSKFPYEEPKVGEPSKSHPWRTSWLVR
jgi:hypothetical protein